MAAVWPVVATVYETMKLPDAGQSCGTTSREDSSSLRSGSTARFAGKLEQPASSDKAAKEKNRVRMGR